MKGKKKIWTEEELQYLKDHFPSMWNKDLAKHFGIGSRSVIRKARELNLEKAEDFREHIDFSKFGQGNIPWNKGIKGKVLSPGCEKTWFPKGHVPAIVRDPEIAERVKNSRNETIRREKSRLRLGYEQKTKLKLVNIYDQNDESNLSANPL